jgi:hypothetical protein
MLHWTDDIPIGSHVIILPPGELSGFRVDGKGAIVMNVPQNRNAKGYTLLSQLFRKFHTRAYTVHHLMEATPPGSTVTITYDIDL